jgi:hypothetical protein
MKCHGNALSRRNFLTVGAVGGLGLTLADYLMVRQAQAELVHYDFIEAKAQSCIHIYLPGGMAHQESFDPKPFSPIEYRGEMRTIKTNTGEEVSETIPHLAKIADKFALIRSMSHGEAAHEPASVPLSATNTARGTICRRTSVFLASRMSLPAAGT